MKFYKSANGKWTIGDYSGVPAGTCVEHKNPTTGQITIRDKEIEYAFELLPTQFQNEAGQHYADLAAYETATADFFVKAPAGSGGGSDSFISQLKTVIFVDETQLQLINPSTLYVNLLANNEGLKMYDNFGSELFRGVYDPETGEHNTSVFSGGNILLQAYTIPNLKGAMNLVNPVSNTSIFGSIVDFETGYYGNIQLNEPIAIVTSDFHTLRAAAIAHKQGYRHIITVAAPTPLINLYNSWLREYFAYGSGWLLNEF